MSKDNYIVAIYPTHIAAEAAVKELKQAGFDMQKLSIVGRDYHTEEHVVGYYNTGTLDQTSHAKAIIEHTKPETLEHHQ